jgi:hypothetical protein
MKHGTNSDEKVFIAKLPNGEKVARVVTRRIVIRNDGRRIVGPYRLGVLHLCGLLARPVFAVTFFAACGFASAMALPVHLQWDAAPVSDSVTGYNVYRSATAGSGYVKLTATPVTAPDFTDDPSGPGPFFFVVTAVNPAGESAFSNEVVYRNLPGAPKNLRIAPASVRSWDTLEPALNKFGAALVGTGTSVDETQALAWSGFGAELLTIANENILKTTTQPSGLRSILDWALSKNLIVLGPGGFFGWNAVVSFQ